MEALTTRELAKGLQDLMNQGRPPTDEELGELHDYIKAQILKSALCSAFVWHVSSSSYDSSYYVDWADS